MSNPAVESLLPASADRTAASTGAAGDAASKCAAGSLTEAAPLRPLAPRPEERKSRYRLPAHRCHPA